MSVHTALSGFIEEKLLNTHTSMPCEVLSFKNGEAVLRPLFLRTTKDSKNIPYEPIISVPCIKQRLKVNNGEPQVYEPVYYKGDIVFVVFSERALDNVLGGKLADPEFNRRHAIEDAVIVGLIK